MTTKIYSQTIIKWLIGIGVLGGTLATSIFWYLSTIGAIEITGYSGDMVCAGTEKDPCFAYINFTAKEDVFIYPTRYDPYGRNTSFNFNPAIKSWKLQRIWGTNWREIPLDKNCTGTWCGLSSKEDKRMFSVAFRKGSKYQIRIVGYKINPTDTIKWGFDKIDPEWVGITEKSTTTSELKLFNVSVENGLKVSFKDYSVTFKPYFVMKDGSTYEWQDIPSNIQKKLWKEQNGKQSYKYGADFSNISKNIKDNLKYVVLHRTDSTGLTANDLRIKDNSIVIKDKIFISHDDLLKTYSIIKINNSDIVIGNLNNTWTECTEEGPVTCFNESDRILNGTRCRDYYVPCIKNKNYSNWISNPDGTFNISFDPTVYIYIETAKHLDESYNFISDISGNVYKQDNNWSETITNNHYVRAKFKEPLDNTRDITIYARSDTTSTIEVYPEGNNTLITKFENIQAEGTYKVYLTNLSGTYDTFDLKSKGNIEYDYIVDPATDTIIYQDLFSDGFFNNTLWMKRTPANIVETVKNLTITGGGGAYPAIQLNKSLNFNVSSRNILAISWVYLNGDPTTAGNYFSLLSTWDLDGNGFEALHDFGQGKLYSEVTALTQVGRPKNDGLNITKLKVNNTHFCTSFGWNTTQQCMAKTKNYKVNFTYTQLISGNLVIENITICDDANYNWECDVTDAAAPTVALNSPANNTWNNSKTINFTGTGTDTGGISNCSLYTNESSWGLKHINTTICASGSSCRINETFENDSVYIWNYLCCDVNGNCGFNTNRTLKIDSTFPNINFTSPTPSNATTITQNSFIINVTITENNLNEFKLNWNNTNYSIYDQNLVLMMNFENKSNLGENNTYFKDLSIYGGSGNCSGTSCPNITNGKYGKGLTFANDYVHIDHNKRFNSTSKGLTVSTWFKTTMSNCISCDFLNKVNVDGWVIWIHDSNISAELSYYWFIDYNTSLSNVLYNGNWHHVALTFNGTTLWSLYYDGILRGTLINKSADTNEPVTLGGWGVGAIAGGYFNGSLDEVRIYNTSLDANSIWQLYSSNLNKLNSSQWYFYSNESNLTNRAYTYYDLVTDMAGNVNLTETKTVIVNTNLDNTPPTFSQNSTNSTNAGQYVRHNLYWNDNLGLSGYIFQFCNGSANGANCIDSSLSNYLCRQETTNISNAADGTCGLSYVGKYSHTAEWISPENGYDWDINTYTYSLTIGQFFINYTKPANATNSSLWQVVDGDAVGSTNQANLSLTIKCWNAYSTQLSLKVNTTFGFTAQWFCYNLTDWNLLRTSPAAQMLFKEESMWWYISTNLSNSWLNYSWVPMTGASNWSNVTKIITSTTGANMSWKVYANDTSNNWNMSDIYPYTTTSITPSNCWTVLGKTLLLPLGCQYITKIGELI